MSEIVIVGSANADLVLSVTRRPGSGETLMGSDFQTLPGGKGANQAVAASRAGGSVSFVGCVGDDGNGALLRASLESANVDTETLLTSNTPTGTAVIFLTPDGENSIVVSPGANHELTLDRASAVEATWRTAQVVVVSLEIPFETAWHVISDAHAHGARVVVNAAPSTALTREVFSACDPLIVNEHEALEVLGATPDDPDATQYETLARRIVAAGAKSAIVTLGKAGAIIADQDGTTWLPAYTVTAVDTTGAGDAFVGAVATVLARGDHLNTAVQFAQAMSALSVQKLGAQTSYAHKAEVCEFMDAKRLLITE